MIVFSDNIFCLREYATVLKCPMIYGATSHAERTHILNAFKHRPEVHPHLRSAADKDVLELLALAHDECRPYVKCMCTCHA